jgi:hypothetical protein
LTEVIRAFDLGFGFDVSVERFPVRGHVERCGGCRASGEAVRQFRELLDERDAAPVDGHLFPYG